MHNAHCAIDITPVARLLHPSLGTFVNWSCTSLPVTCIFPSWQHPLHWSNHGQVACPTNHSPPADRLTVMTSSGREWPLGPADHCRNLTGQAVADSEWHCARGGPNAANDIDEARCRRMQYHGAVESRSMLQRLHLPWVQRAGMGAVCCGWCTPPPPHTHTYWFIGPCSVHVRTEHSGGPALVSGQHHAGQPSGGTGFGGPTDGR